MTPYAAGSVVDLTDILAMRLRLWSSGKQEISDKEYSDPFGDDTVTVVSAENLASVPAWVAGTASRATERALSEDCDADRRAAIADSVRRVAEFYILDVLDGLRSDVPPHSSHPPAGFFEIVSDAVHKNVPMYYLLRALRIAHLSITEDLSVTSRNAGDRHCLTIRDGQARDYVSAYADDFSARIAHIYVTEEDKQTGDRSVARERLVTDVIAGRPVDHAEAEWILGLDLAHHHLAFVLWALPGAEVSSGQLDRFAIELARALGSRRPLIMPSGPTKAWTWTSWPRPPEDGLVARVCKTLSPPPGIQASIGPVAAGVTGFRRSHLGAQAAARVASAGEWGNSWFCDYADVAVVSLVTNDPQQARWFVEETLGALGQPGRRLAELRETLRVYLAFGRSRLHAAERLHLARNTVAYRVDKAIGLLGRQISGDELQVRLALEIARVLPNEP